MAWKSVRRSFLWLLHLTSYEGVYISRKKSVCNKPGCCCIWGCTLPSRTRVAMGCCGTSEAENSSCRAANKRTTRWPRGEEYRSRRGRRQCPGVSRGVANAACSYDNDVMSALGLRLATPARTLTLPLTTDRYKRLIKPNKHPCRFYIPESSVINDDLSMVRNEFLSIIFKNTPIKITFTNLIRPNLRQIPSVPEFRRPIFWMDSLNQLTIRFRFIKALFLFI